MINEGAMVSDFTTTIKFIKGKQKQNKKTHIFLIQFGNKTEHIKGNISSY